MRIPGLLALVSVLMAWPCGAAAQELNPSNGVPLNALIQREAVRLALSTDQAGTLPRPQRQVRCASKKQGAVLGAVVGAAAGVFVSYLLHRGHDPSVIPLGGAVRFAAGGAGIGALIGYAACTR